MLAYQKAQELKQKFGDQAKQVVEEILNALEDYDQSTENYLKEEFGIEYFSSELQNMDSDFRYWEKVKLKL